VLMVVCGDAGRVQAVGQKTVIGASGEYSDFAYIMTLLEEITTDDYCRDDGETLTPKEVRPPQNPLHPPCYQTLEQACSTARRAHG
jgi:hypothetical protein